MSTHAYDEVLNNLFNQAQHLTPDEQLQLLQDLDMLIRQIQDLQERLQHRNAEQPLHNITEFRGFAKELWQGVDVEKYLDEERNSWGG